MADFIKGVQNRVSRANLTGITREQIEKIASDLGIINNDATTEQIKEGFEKAKTLQSNLSNVEVNELNTQPQGVNQMAQLPGNNENESKLAQGIDLNQVILQALETRNREEATLKNALEALELIDALRDKVNNEYSEKILAKLAEIDDKQGINDTRLKLIFSERINNVEQRSVNTENEIKDMVQTLRNKCKEQGLLLN